VDLDGRQECVGVRKLTNVKLKKAPKICSRRSQTRERTPPRSSPARSESLLRQQLASELPEQVQVDRQFDEAIPENQLPARLDKLDRSVVVVGYRKLETLRPLPVSCGWKTSRLNTSIVRNRVLYRFEN
jgi:hypothetical protein